MRSVVEAFSLRIPAKKVNSKVRKPILQFLPILCNQWENQESSTCFILWIWEWVWVRGLGWFWLDFGFVEQLFPSPALSIDRQRFRSAWTLSLDITLLRNSEWSLEPVMNDLLRCFIEAAAAHSTSIMGLSKFVMEDATLLTKSLEVIDSSGVARGKISLGFGTGTMGFWTIFTASWSLPAKLDSSTSERFKSLKKLKWLLDSYYNDTIWNLDTKTNLPVIFRHHSN